MFDSTDAFDMLDALDIWGMYNPKHQPDGLPQERYADSQSEAEANHGSTFQTDSTPKLSSIV